MEIQYLQFWKIYQTEEGNLTQLHIYVKVNVDPMFRRFRSEN